MGAPSLIDYKALALLHDPPWKPWLLMGKRNCYLAGINECSGHEDDAEKLFHSVWPWQGVIGGKAVKNPLVKRADVLASTMDRYVLDYVYAPGRGIISAKKLRIVNILRPDKAIEIRGPPTSNEVGEYIDELRDLLKLAQQGSLDKSLVYNILYAFYEILWYKHCKSKPHEGACAPPADTRFPTHTVFDHARAAASMMNWLDEEGFCGYLVYVDIAGIQSFISNSRKVRDLWASSWIVSALTWYVVSELVRYLGPDIVLSPALELNPFYYSSLIKWLMRGPGSSNDKLVEKIMELLTISGVDLKNPDQPLMPGTVLLALPCRVDEELMKNIDSKELQKALQSGGEEGWRTYFMRRYVEGWRRIVDRLDRHLNIDDIVCKCIGTRGDGADRGDECSAAKELIHKTRDRPPLLIRIAVADVRESRERLKSELSKRREVGKLFGDQAVGASKLADSFLLHWLLRKSLYEKVIESGLKSVRLAYSGAAADLFEEYTESLYRSGKAFLRCSMCGVEPAVMRFVRDACVGISDSAAFTEGEQLGPYCLIKRLIGLRFMDVADELGLYLEKANLPIPSTTELANLAIEAEFLCELARKLPIQVVVGESGMSYQLRSLVKEICADRVKEAEELYSLSFCPLSKSWEKEPIPLYDALTTGDNEEANEYVDRFIECLKDYLKTNKGVDLGEVEKVIRNAFERARRNARRYYALIRGDGDFFGSRILSGRLPIKGDEYIQAVLSMAEATGDVDGLIGFVREFLKIANDVLRESGQTAEITVIVTPSYHRTVSRAMMATALKDYEIVKERFGALIFAGGDDVAAVAPAYVSYSIKEERESSAEIVIPPSKIVAETRRSFWGSEKAPCFHLLKLGGDDMVALYPALCAYGRSYGVVIAHHKDPFRQVWDLAGELEELKDVAGANEVYSGREWKKDITALYYGRVGSAPIWLVKKQAAILPNVLVGEELKKPGIGVSIAETIAKNVESGYFSKSLLYDATKDGFIEKVNALTEMEPERVEDLIKVVLERNRSPSLPESVMGDLLTKLKQGIISTRIILGDPLNDVRSAISEVFKASRALYSGRR